MCEDRFKENDEVYEIFFVNGGSLRRGTIGIDRITVVMENGQMDGVPWFAVWKDGKIVVKYNGAMLLSVRTSC